MSRIQPVRQETADRSTAELLGAVKKKLGVVPNLIATMANSAAVTTAYLGFSESLSSGSLPARLREQIALAVGQWNGCNYCLAAHTAIGKRAGLSDQQARDARRGKASDAKESAALHFARRILSEQGHVADDEIHKIRDAGYTDGEIAEIVANVAINIFTNYFNHVAGTEVDFPAAPELAAA